MPDKLEQDFNLFYIEANNFNSGFTARKHEVETDKMLSRAGKFEQVEKIKTEHLKNVNNLGERFQADFGERLSKIGRYVRGEKPDPVLDSIQKRFTKGESLSSEESNKLLLSEMRETKDIMRKSNFQNMLSTADIEQVKKTAQTLNDSKDVEKLTWLQESVSLKGDSVLSNSLAGQIEGLKDSQLSDEQRNLKAISERIEKGMELFNYTLERLRTGVFIDARNDEIQ